MGARDQEGGGTRLDEAKRRAKELVSAMDRNAVAMVIAFDDSARLVQAFTSDQNQLKAAIDRIEPGDRRTNLKQAYQLAEAQVNFDPEQLRPGKEEPDVRLFSDGRVQEANDLRIKAKVTYEKIGSDTAGNVAVVALNAKRNYERPTQVQVFARLANFGPEPLEVPVQLAVDGETVNVGGNLQGCYLLPERWTEDKRQTHEKSGGRAHQDSVQFKLDLTQSAVVRIEQMAKEGDVLSADDVAQVVVPPPKTMSVLVVTDGNYFLERAVRAMSVEKPDFITPGTYEEQAKSKQVPTKYDVIIFDNYKPPTDPETKQAVLPEAGNFIYFGAVPDGIKTKVATVRAPATRPGAPAQPAAAGAGEPIILKDVGVLDWKREHPILQNLSLGKMYAGTALKLDVPLDREVLLDGLTGPLIVLDREAKRTHLLVAFDLLQSDWPLRRSFPVFMYQALQFLAVGSEMNLRQSFQPGDSVRIPRGNLLQAGGGTDPDKVVLTGPRGKRDVPVPESGDFVLPPLERVGLYTTEPAVPQFEKLAVNLLDANESNLLPSNDPPGQIGKRDEKAEGTGKGRTDLWWFLAAGGLLVLFVEWWVYTRRVHL
jgi:hypothetical protein